MSESEEKRIHIQSQIKNLNSAFEQAIRQFEEGKTEQVLQHSRQIVMDMRGLIKDLSSNYGENLKRRLNGFDGLKDQIEDFLENKNLANQDALIPALQNLGKALDQVNREVRFQYPNPVLVPFVKKYWKLGVAGAIVILVFSFIVMGINAFRLRKYGLEGMYYAGTGFERLVKTRLDHQINFRWGLKAPMMGMPKDKFSVRWTGFLKVPTKGVYEFHVGSDDGARLWVADQKVIDQWTTHKFQWNNGSIPLESGYQPIRLEYFEAKKGAGVELAWRFETDNKPSTIPRENLVPNEKYLEKE